MYVGTRKRSYDRVGRKRSLLCLTERICTDAVAVLVPDEKPDGNIINHNLAKRDTINMMNEYIDPELQEWVMEGGLGNTLIKLSEDSFSEPYPLSDTRITNVIDQNSRKNDLELFLDYFTSEKQDSACSNITSERKQKTMNPISTSAEVAAAPDLPQQQHLPRFREYQDTQWDEQHRGLLQYIQKHGHCCVPNKLDENPRLGRWVSWPLQGEYQFLFPFSLTTNHVLIFSRSRDNDTNTNYFNKAKSQR